MHHPGNDPSDQHHHARSFSWNDIGPLEIGPVIEEYTNNAGGIVFTNTKDSTHMINTSPCQMIRDFQGISKSDEFDHFKHAMQCTVRLQISHTGYLFWMKRQRRANAKVFTLAQGAWFSRDSTASRTDELISVKHPFHKYLRYSYYYGMWVQCGPYYPFKYELNGVKGRRVDENGKLMQQDIIFDINSIATFGEDGAIIRAELTDSDKFMVPPTREQISILNKQVRKATLGWCYSMFDNDVGKDDLYERKAIWPKGDQIPVPFLKRFFRLENRSPANPNMSDVVVSAGRGTGYDLKQDKLFFKAESLRGMCGGPIACTLLPRNVLAGIGNGECNGYSNSVGQGLNSLVLSKLLKLRKFANYI